MNPLFLLCLLWLYTIAWTGGVHLVGADTLDEDSQTSKSDGDVGGVNSVTWQTCSIFAAPSSVPSGGWGVFAGRDFDKMELVEITPLLLPFPYGAPIIKNTVLDDYTYGYRRSQSTPSGKQKRPTFDDDSSMVSVVLGQGMFYNHNNDANVAWASLGRSTAGFVAMRKIEAGEELFSSYGSEESGLQWFVDRRLTLMEIPPYSSRKNGTVLEQDMNVYCSKTYAGIGKPSFAAHVEQSWKSRHRDLPFSLQRGMLAEWDHPSTVVHTKADKGDILEMSPALALRRDFVVDTKLAGLSFFWDDLNQDQRAALRALREANELKLQHQSSNASSSSSGSWERMDRFTTFDDVVIVPAGGFIGLVNRVVGPGNEANCKLEIVSSGSMTSYLSHGGGGGSAGILLKLVATKQLQPGDALVLDDVRQQSNSQELVLLMDEFKHYDQPIPEWLTKRVARLRDEL